MVSFVASGRHVTFLKSAIALCVGCVVGYMFARIPTQMSGRAELAKPRALAHESLDTASPSSTHAACVSRILSAVRAHLDVEIEFNDCRDMNGHYCSHGLASLRTISGVSDEIDFFCVSTTDAKDVCLSIRRWDDDYDVVTSNATFDLASKLIKYRNEILIEGLNSISAVQKLNVLPNQTHDKKFRYLLEQMIERIFRESTTIRLQVDSTQNDGDITCSTGVVFITTIGGAIDPTRYYFAENKSGADCLFLTTDHDRLTCIPGCSDAMLKDELFRYVVAMRMERLNRDTY